MGIHLKDMIYGVCQKAIKAEQDENGANIVKSYQKKLGCGYFTGNIDYINKNSVFYCDASNKELSGHLPIIDARNYEFFLKTDFVEEGTQSSQKMQTAIVFKSGIHKKFMRSGDAGGYTQWAEIPTDGTLKEFYIVFDSEDSLNPTEWTNFKTVQNFASGKLSKLFSDISIMSKNLKYLRKLIGTTDISKLADGTLTGIVNSLNTDIQDSKDYASCAHGIVTLQGWYRIAKSKGHYGNNSCTISLKRSFNSPAPEFQKIQFFGVYDLRKFISLAALSRSHIWLKIRETWDVTNDVSYIEIYQNGNSSTNIWAISIGDVFSAYGGDYDWTAITPTQTQETVSGVTVLASLDLPANNPN